MAKKVLKFPVLKADQGSWKKGSLIDYGVTAENVEWVDQRQWTETLKLEGSNRGRSSVQFIWVSVTTGKRYPMFLTDLTDLLFLSVISDACVTETWEFCKRGCNYGIRKVA